MRLYVPLDYPEVCHECGEPFAEGEQRLGVVVSRGVPEGPVDGLAVLAKLQSFHMRHAPPPGSSGRVMGDEQDGRKGRERYGPLHFASVAAIYREGLANKLAPTKHVAEVFSVSRSTAAKWVIRARQLGLLGQTNRGRASA